MENKKKYSVVSFFRGRNHPPYDLYMKYKDWDYYSAEYNIQGSYWVHHFRREKN